MKAPSIQAIVFGLTLCGLSSLTTIFVLRAGLLPIQPPMATLGEGIPAVPSDAASHALSTLQPELQSASDFRITPHWNTKTHVFDKDPATGTTPTLASSSGLPPNTDQVDLDGIMYELLDAHAGDSVHEGIIDDKLASYRAYRRKRGEEPFQYLDAARAREKTKVSSERLTMFTKMFSGPEHFTEAFPPEKRVEIDASFETLPDANLAKQMTANKMLVGTIMNQDVPEERWPVVKTQYAKAALGWNGEGEIPEQHFYTLAGEALTACRSGADYEKLERADLINTANTVDNPSPKPSAKSPPIAKVNASPGCTLEERVARLESEMRAKGGQASPGAHADEEETAHALEHIIEVTATETKGGRRPPDMTPQEIETAHALYEGLKEAQRDPVGFNEKMKHADPEAKKGWQLLLEDIRRKQQESR